MERGEGESKELSGLEIGGLEVGGLEAAKGLVEDEEPTDIAEGNWVIKGVYKGKEIKIYKKGSDSKIDGKRISDNDAEEIYKQLLPAVDYWQKKRDEPRRKQEEADSGARRIEAKLEGELYRKKLDIILEPSEGDLEEAKKLKMEEVYDLDNTHLFHIKGEFKGVKIEIRKTERGDPDARIDNESTQGPEAIKLYNKLLPLVEHWENAAAVNDVRKNIQDI